MEFYRFKHFRRKYFRSIKIFLWNLIESIEEIKTNIWSGFTPQIETNTKKSKAPRSTSIYFLTKCVRALGNSALVPILATKESVKRLRIKKTIKIFHFYIYFKRDIPTIKRFRYLPIIGCLPNLKI